MSAFKHTPGPWEARMGEFDFGNDGSRRIMVGDRNAGSYRRIGTVDTVLERTERGKNKTAYNAPDEERDANVLLFAAAPDLLLALVGLVEKGTDSPQHKAAEAAIAKALGK